MFRLIPSVLNRDSNRGGGGGGGGGYDNLLSRTLSIRGSISRCIC